MTKGTITLFIVVLIIVILSLLISLIFLVIAKKKKKINNILQELEREKNDIISSALLNEFQKIEALNNSKIKKKELNNGINLLIN